MFLLRLFALQKRLMINLQTVKDAYRSFEASAVALVKSQQKFEDALRNAKIDLIFMKAIKQGKIDHSIKHYIIRT